MTNQNHPITPPKELEHKWASMFERHSDAEVFSEVAQWGADQELEACCEWMAKRYGEESHAMGLLRAARRPKPPSLKEQALDALEQLLRDPEAGCFAAAPDTIRRALEALPND
jgi:hypothetical protein